MRNVSARVDVVMAVGTPAVKAEHVEAAPEQLAVAAEPEEVEQEHTHKPVQHRDGKERWCNTCGLTADGRTPEYRLLPAGQ